MYAYDSLFILLYSNPLAEFHERCVETTRRKNVSFKLTYDQ